MGNSSSLASLKVNDGTLEHVAFDMSQQSIKVKYGFGRIKGKFELPLGLGKQVVTVEDPLELARTGMLETATLPVKLEAKRKVDSSAEFPGASELKSEAGLLAGVEKEEGKWELLGRVESDMGGILVFTRVSKDIKTRLKADLNKRSWLGWKQSWLIARTEGTLQLAVMLRFETAADRSLLAPVWRSMMSPLTSFLRALHLSSTLPRITESPVEDPSLSDPPRHQLSPQETSPPPQDPSLLDPARPQLSPQLSPTSQEKKLAMKIAEAW